MNWHLSGFAFVLQMGEMGHGLSEGVPPKAGHRRLLCHLLRMNGRFHPILHINGQSRLGKTGDTTRNGRGKFVTIFSPLFPSFE